MSSMQGKDVDGIKARDEAERGGEDSREQDNR